MEQISFLAFDLGATSGRSILGTLRDGKLQMKELTRFPNQILELGGHYYCVRPVQELSLIHI